MKKIILSLALIAISVGLSAQIHVKPVSSGSKDGTSWNNACSLEDAMSMPASEIWVQNGTYTLSGTLTVPDATRIYGGFTGTESQLPQRNYAQNPTIIRGNGTFSVVQLGLSAVLDGLTIENGSAIQGGGVYMKPNARVENCIIQHNQALNDGGGIYAEGDGLVYNSLIIKNRAGKDGAAIYGTTLTVNSSTVSDNETMDCPSITNTSVAAICAGETTTLTISDPGSYLWNTGATTQSITTPALTTSTTYTATVTSPENCMFVLTFEVTVKPQPTLEITTEPNPASPGDVAIFIAKGTPEGGNYLWNDLAATTNDTLTVTMDAAGEPQFTCTYNLDGCEVEETATIQNSNCVAPTDPTGLSADLLQVCEGGSTTLRLTGGTRNSGTWVLYSGSCGGTQVATSNRNNNVTFDITPTANTTYFVRGEGCGIETSCVQVSITVPPIPGVITPENPEICVGETVQLANLTAGGTWSSGLSGNVSVDADGLVTGLTAGTGTVYYTLSTSCRRSIDVVVKATPTPIAGDTNLCILETQIFTSLPIGGTWSSTSPAVATINAVGEATATTLGGSTVLRYAHPATGCEVTQTVVVHQQPAKTSGSRTVCQYDSIRLTNPTNGGTWSISAGKATIDPEGVLKGTAPGTVVVAYTIGHCQDTFLVEVNPAVKAVTGALDICLNQYPNPVYSNLTPGGTWSSSNTSIATIVPETGEVTALAVGNFDVIYTVPQGCSARLSVVVRPLPDAITGNNTVGIGQTTTLSTTSTGGQWTSSNPSIATIDRTTGVVTGISQGTTTIRYQFTSEGNCFTSFPMMVVSCDSLYLSSLPTTSAQEVCNNAPITDIVYAISYQTATSTSISWTKNGAPIAAAPTGLTYNPSTLTLSGASSEAGEYSYTIKVEGQASGCPAASISGNLKIYDVVVGGEIAADQTFCGEGNPAEFSSVTAGSGGNPETSIYNWQSSSDGTTFVSLPGTNSPVFDETQTLSANNAPTVMYYRRQYTDACGTAYSNVITVTVNPQPDAPTATITDNSACVVADNGSIEVTAPTGTGLTYSIDGTTFGTATTFANLGQGSYTIYVRNAYSCESSAQFTVNNSAGAPAITGFTVTPNDSICNTELATTDISITPVLAETSGTFSYLWNTGATTQTLTLPAGTLTAATDYTVTVTNTADNCKDSATQRINVMEPISTSPITINDPDDICINGTAPEISANISGSSTGLKYQWQSSPSGDEGTFADAAGSSQSSTYQVPTHAASDLFYRITVSRYGVCQAQNSNIVNVKVVDNAPLIDIEGDSGRCETGFVILYANNSNGANPTDSIRWYDALTGGNLLGTTAYGESFETPQISQTTVFYAQPWNSTCGSSSVRYAVEATVQSPNSFVFANPAQQNLTVYQDDDLTISLLGTNYNNAPLPQGDITPEGNVTLIWSPSAPSGITTDEQLTNSTISGSPTASGVYTYKLVMDNIGYCSHTDDTVIGTITIVGVPAAPTAVPGGTCGPGEATISAIAAIPTDSIRWYDAATDGNLLATTLSGEPFTTPSISTATTYYAEVWNSSTALASATRTAVVATVDEQHVLTHDPSSGEVDQTVYLSVPNENYSTVTPIRFTASGGATGMLVTWTALYGSLEPQPPGITPPHNSTHGTTVTISGKPTVAWFGRYTITTTGGVCPSKTQTGRIYADTPAE